MTPEQKRMLRKTIVFTLLAAGVFLGFRYALPLFLPFILAYFIARAIEPLILQLTNRTGGPRALFSGIFVAALFFIPGFLGYLAFLRLLREAKGFVKALPALLEGVRATAGGMDRFFDWLIASAHPDIKELLHGYAVMVSDAGGKFIGGLSEKAGTWLASFAAAIPGFMFSVFTAVLASFFMSADYQNIRASFLRRLPSEMRERLIGFKRQISATLLRWLRAEAILAGIAFLELFIGFSAFQVEFSLLLSLSIAAVDILPVFGVGTVLLPWAAFEFFAGARGMGVRLLLLYGVIFLTRTFAEPRIVGKQMGLSPLLALFSMYVGFALFGIPGLILAPVAANVISGCRQ